MSSFVDIFGIRFRSLYFKEHSDWLLLTVANFAQHVDNLIMFLIIQNSYYIMFLVMNVKEVKGLRNATHSSGG